MFHRINESMVLGMHPAISCPRRSQFRPLRVRVACPAEALGGGGRRSLPRHAFLHCTWPVRKDGPYYGLEPRAQRQEPKDKASSCA